MVKLTYKRYTGREADLEQLAELHGVYAVTVKRDDVLITVKYEGFPDDEKSALFEEAAKKILGKRLVA